MIENEPKPKTPEDASGIENDPLAPESDPAAELYPDKDPMDSTHAVIGGLQDELDKAKDQMIRAMAETENIRKRAAKEREDARKFSIAGFAKDLLAVADNLRRALDSVPTDLLDTEPRLQAVIGGIEATERELLKSFEKNGITKLVPGEEIFNPNLHEVMFEAPSPGKPAGTIIQVVECGYMLHDRLIRPARVGVVKDDGSSAPSGNDASPGGHIDTQA